MIASFLLQIKPLQISLKSNEQNSNDEIFLILAATQIASSPINKMR